MLRTQTVLSTDDHWRSARRVYLRVGRDLVAAHLADHHDHFMPTSLLRSQIDTLEEPDPVEDALVVDVGPPVSQVAAEIIKLLGASAMVAKR